MTFPIDEKIKALLDDVCKSLNVSLEEWVKTALEVSESDVFVHFPDNPVDQRLWTWDESSCQFVRRSDTD